MVFLCLLLTSCFVFIFVWAISYITHIYMNKSEKLKYDYVTFDTFLKEFAKYEDDPEMKYGDGSILLIKWEGYSYNHLVYLHASIVKFNDKCMIFYPVDWLKYCIWMKIKTNEVYRVKGLWTQE